MGKIKADIEKLKQSKVCVEGVCNTKERMTAIEDAIALIQKDPSDAMRKNYIGIKNYASFGDQREDHTYGYGPRHGSIVFRIERKSSGMDSQLGENEIYFLLCVRDFPGFIYEDERGRERKMDLSRVLVNLRTAEEDSIKYRSALDFEVEI
jgi:hypothetical protein